MAALANEKREKQAAEIARQMAEENFNLMKIQFDRAEANVALTMEAFDQMFKQVIARGIRNSRRLEH
jgi:L-alanine-DL-glutamate epimerase-like enolase superfamily enzyme